MNDSDAVTRLTLVAQTTVLVSAVKFAIVCSITVRP